jgi:Raf kinase inhibitor-like YbhB/YbcL family protein
MAQIQDTTRSNPSTRGLAQEFRLSSPAFADGSRIPERHSADSENRSPRLTWGQPPEGTGSFALVCEDPDAPKGLFVHWLLWNLPAHRRQLEEHFPTTAELSDGARQGQNGFGNTGYGGPRPPPGAPHRYVFRLYALDTLLELEAGANRAAFDRALEGHILGEATLTGMFGRS